MTPTREQLASIEWVMARTELRNKSTITTVHRCPACEGEKPAHAPDCWLAACLAAPPPEPQAMPPIEVGDVVALVNGNAEAVLTQSHADYWNDRRPELLRAERITAIYRTSLWTREPRR